jgi:hypothetical protein
VVILLMRVRGIIMTGCEAYRAKPFLQVATAKAKEASFLQAATTRVKEASPVQAQKTRVKEVSFQP